MDFIEKVVSIVYFLGALFFHSEPKNLEDLKERPISYVRISDEVTRLIIKEVEEELGFRCEASGGSMPDDIESISLGFAVYERASVERAREIEVAIIEKFLKIINSYEEVRPFLREYPFPASRANIKLSFYDKRKKRSQSGDCVCFVFQANGELIYCSNPLEEGYELVEIATEKYEDALDFVQRSRSTSL